MLRLDELHVDTSARLTRVAGTGGFRRRLLELGFLPGTPLRVVRRAEIGGVVELELRGCRVALRTAEAQSILVEAS